MIGTVEATGPDAPKGWSKHDHGQKKEDAHDFKPDNAAYAAEGAQKAAYAAGHAPCSLTGSPAMGGSRGNWAGGHTGSGLRVSGCALADDAPRDAQADAQSAADGVRFHSAMMVAAPLAEPVFCKLLPLPCCRETAMEVR